MNSFTRGLAKELAPSNIQVNAIACGCIDTQMNACFSEEERAALLVIDLERGFIDESSPLCIRDAAATLPACGQAITYAREEGVALMDERVRVANHRIADLEGHA